MKNRKCPFYGHYAAELAETLVSIPSNRCALIVDAHAPCEMEIDGKEPVLENCAHNESEPAKRFIEFRVCSRYPD